MAEPTAMVCPRTETDAPAWVLRLNPWPRRVIEFILAMLLQAAIMGFAAWTFDEGLCLYGAVQVLHGQIPYRDFFTLYPPGEYYLLAGIFKLFGVTVLWDRVLFILINAVAIVAILYVLDRLTGRFWLNRAVALAVLLWLNSGPAYAFPVFPAMALILVATAFMVKRWQGGRSHWALWSGFSLGLAALFRHDLALFALFALAGTSVVDWLRVPKAERGTARGDVVRLVLGSAAVVAPVVVLLLIFVPAHDLYYSLLYVPIVLYPKIRSLPFPTLAQVIHGFLHPITRGEAELGSLDYNIVWLPVVALLSAVPLVVSELRKPKIERSRATGVVALILLTGFLFLKGLVRVSPVHMIQSVVPAFMLLGCLLAWMRARGPVFRVCVLFAALWAVLCDFPAVRNDYYMFEYDALMYSGRIPRLEQACHPAAGLERMRCMFVPEADRQAILFVQSETRPGEPIFVGVPRYDVLRESMVQFYFLSGRESASVWYQLCPGVQTTAPIQQQMIDELERKRVRIVVQDDEIFPPEPNVSRFSSGVDILGEYIRKNYAAQRRFGDLEILQRVTPFS